MGMATSKQRICDGTIDDKSTGTMAASTNHCYDVMLRINGVPAVQTELKILGMSPRRAIMQIADCKFGPLAKSADRSPDCR